MIDLSKIEQYRENNRIEAKKALGGLPKSIWETYSAFANTLGGIILLGVEEDREHVLHTINLPDPERLVREFWEIVRNPKKASVNILAGRHVQIETIGGNRIIVITVPRAQRYDKPVYVEGNPFSGSYRRSGEGDYRCTREEVQSMFRDAAVQTQDMKVLEFLGTDALDWESVRRYRARTRQYRPCHAWEDLADPEFLRKLGAIGRGADGALHPTGAGLLMFGFAREIVREFPHYSLDYREYLGSDDAQVTDRIFSSSGGWSGNLYDFYFHVSERITRDIPLALRRRANGAEDAAAACRALGEALANCLVNADYYGQQGISAVKCRGMAAFSNPGAFRIEVEAAKSGGVSDPRNGALVRMFHLAGIGERMGGGIPNIYSVWKKLGWAPPVIEEQFNPDRITVSLPTQRSGGRTPGRGGAGKTAVHKAAMIVYLTDNVSGRTSDFAQLLGLKDARVRALLGELIAEGIVVPEGGRRYRVYKLKA